MVWTVAGKDPEASAVEYESLFDALMNFSLEGVNGGSGQ